MSTARRIVATAAATGALVTGLLATAPQAVAGTANPTYTCSGWGMINTEFSHVGSSLVIIADIPAGYPVATTTTVTTQLVGYLMPGPSAVLPPGFNDGSVALVGPYMSLSAAPAVNVTVTPSGGTPLHISCTVVAPGTGWPV